MESEYDVGVGVTLEVGSALVKPLVKIEVERREKIPGYVARGGESEDDVGVGVTLEVGSACVKPLVKIEVERWEKILWYVARGEEFEGG